MTLHKLAVMSLAIAAVSLSPLWALMGVTAAAAGSPAFQRDTAVSWTSSRAWAAAVFPSWSKESLV